MITLSRIMTALLVLTTIGIVLAMIAAVTASTASARWLSLAFLVATMIGFVIAARELRSEGNNQNRADDQD